MKAKDKTTGQFKKVYVKALDGMPVGSEIDYSGNISDIPTGWEVVSDNAKILWTNPNPTSSFSAQNITLSSNNYDILEIFYYSYTDRLTVNSVRVKKGQDANLMAIFQYQNHGWIGNRDIRYTNDTQLYVDATVSIVRNDAFSRQAENSWCIPIFIIGYKLGIFN